MTPIRVVLADDHPIVRTGIRTMLAKATDIIVVAEVGNGPDVLIQLAQMAPDVLLLDMEMPGLSGVEVAQKLKAAKSKVKVLALSAHDDEVYVRSLLANGAVGYLTKEEAPELIVDAVRGIARGEKGWISRRAAAQMLGWTHQQEEVELTDREMQVLKQAALGKTNREIALALGIADKTVEKHMGGVFEKLQVSSRLEAVMSAVKKGWLTPPSG
ncbi:response regulator transcription factor [soil metagenome]